MTPHDVDLIFEWSLIFAAISFGTMCLAIAVHTTTFALHRPAPFLRRLS